MFIIRNQLVTFALLLVAFTIVTLADRPKDYFAIDPKKGSMCHHPNSTYECENSPFKMFDYKLAGWFYHSIFRSCRPIYTPDGKHLCEDNQDIPLTKEECEDSCGEPCKDGYGVDGICMFEEYCHPIMPSSSNPRPCGPYEVKCCPRASTSKLVQTNANNTEKNEEENSKLVLTNATNANVTEKNEEEGGNSIDHNYDQKNNTDTL